MKTVVTTTELQKRRLIARLAELSCYFEVTPLPDDECEIRVKNDLPDRYLRVDPDDGASSEVHATNSRRAD